MKTYITPMKVRIYDDTSKQKAERKLIEKIYELLEKHDNALGILNLRLAKLEQKEEIK